MSDIIKRVQELMGNKQLQPINLNAPIKSEDIINYSNQYGTINFFENLNNQQMLTSSIEDNEIMSYIFQAIDENEDGKIDEKELSYLTSLNNDGDEGTYLTQNDISILLEKTNTSEQAQEADVIAQFDTQMNALLEKYFPGKELEDITDEQIQQAFFIEELIVETAEKRKTVEAYFATEGWLDDAYNSVKDIFGGLTHEQINEYLDNEETLNTMLQEAIKNGSIAYDPEKMSDIIGDRFTNAQTSDELIAQARNLGYSNEEIAHIFEMSINGYMPNSELSSEEFIEYRKQKDKNDWFEVKVDENGNFIVVCSDSQKSYYETLGVENYQEKLTELLNDEYYLYNAKNILSEYANQNPPKSLTFEQLYNLYTGTNYNPDAISELNSLSFTYEKVMGMYQSANMQEELFASNAFRNPSDVLNYFKQLYQCSDEEAIQFFNQYYDTMFAKTNEDGDSFITAGDMRLGISCTSFNLSADGSQVIEEYRIDDILLVELEALECDGFEYDKKTGIITRKYPISIYSDSAEVQNPTGFFYADSVFDVINKQINENNLYLDEVIDSYNQNSKVSFEEVINNYTEKYQEVYGNNILNEKFDEYTKDMDTYASTLSTILAGSGFILSFVPGCQWAGWLALGGAFTDNTIDLVNLISNEKDGEFDSWAMQTLAEAGMLAVGMKLGSWANKLGSKTSAYLNTLPEESWLAKLLGPNVKISPTAAHWIGTGVEYGADVLSGTAWDAGVSFVQAGEFNFGENLLSNLIYGTADIKGGIALYRTLVNGDAVDLGNGLQYQYKDGKANYTFKDDPSALLTKNADNSWTFTKNGITYNDVSFQGDIIRYQESGKLMEFNATTGKTTQINSYAKVAQDADSKECAAIAILNGIADKPELYEAMMQNISYNPKDSTYTLKMFDGEELVVKTEQGQDTNIINLVLDAYRVEYYGTNPGDYAGRFFEDILPGYNDVLTKPTDTNFEQIKTLANDNQTVLTLNATSALEDLAPNHSYTVKAIDENGTVKLIDPLNPDEIIEINYAKLQGTSVQFEGKTASSGLVDEDILANQTQGIFDIFTKRKNGAKNSKSAAINLNKYGPNTKLSEFHEELLQNGIRWLPFVSDSTHSAWKMHIYAKNNTDLANIVRTVIPYCFDAKLNCKHAGMPLYSAIQDGDQKGKAITIYARSAEELKQTAKDIDYIIRNNNMQLENTHIKGDRALGDSGRIFYRYEYNTKEYANEIIDVSTPEGRSLYDRLYEENRGGDNYLAKGMTIEDDPFYNYDPSTGETIVTNATNSSNAQKTTVSSLLSKNGTELQGTPVINTSNFRGELHIKQDNNWYNVGDNPVVMIGGKIYNLRRYNITEGEIIAFGGRKDIIHPSEENKYMSATQLYIYFENGIYYIKDANSSNGTKIIR
ncbi:MAG: hypothetical protein IJ003_05450 [Candidatus Gastranaerophilales bacterium]|nr:hypothetical protein [Candidatus Gastranaerophilales bacterium]